MALTSPSPTASIVMSLLGFVVLFPFRGIYSVLGFDFYLYSLLIHLFIYFFIFFTLVGDIDSVWSIVRGEALIFNFDLVIKISKQLNGFREIVNGSPGRS